MTDKAKDERDIEKFSAFEQVARQVLNLPANTALWEVKGESETQFAFAVYTFALEQTAELRAEVERLRDAIEQLAVFPQSFCPGENRCICGGVMEWANSVLNKSTKALADSTGGGE